MEQWNDRMGQWVYFVRSTEGGPIKIGTTTGDPERRMRDLQTSSPFPLVCIGLLRGGRKLEAQLHDKFKEARLSGEWFRPVPELLEFIRNIREGERTDEGLDIQPLSLSLLDPEEFEGLPDVLTVDETAKLLRISRMHAYESVREGIIPSFRIGSRILVPKSRLIALLHGPQTSLG